MSLWGRENLIGRYTRKDTTIRGLPTASSEWRPTKNRHTNPVRFIDKAGQLIYAQPAAVNTDPFDARRLDTLGRGYMTANDSLVRQPFDFTGRNKFPLEAFQQILQIGNVSAVGSRKATFCLNQRRLSVCAPILIAVSRRKPTTPSTMPISILRVMPNFSSWIACTIGYPRAFGCSIKWDGPMAFDGCLLRSRL